MSQALPVRASRRAATIKQRIVESSDDENVDPSANSPDEEDFTPVAKKPFRKPLRQQHEESPEAAIEDTTEEGIIPAMQPLDDITQQVVPSTGRLPKASRRSVRASRKSVLPAERDTLAPSTSLESTECDMSSNSTVSIKEEADPLADLTTTDGSATTNDLPSTVDIKQAEDVVMPDVDMFKDVDIVEERTVAPKTAPPPPSQSQLEKPMDIVIRSRSKAIPTTQDHAEARPRTIITYLVLNNFKSYAGRQEVGPFHASFSSVVGPNGSGKSNVIDSLLFVFGFRASKMRQGKVSALIHNSAAYPDLDHCEVQVHFQEVMDQPCGIPELIPNSDLVISRKAFKNNSSKYFINGAESNFTAVTTLLRGRGVDLDHKRFLILQGEVESIAQMKPKAASEHDDGLLEYLEDIIGTSKYKSPIDESAAETETLNEVCTEKNHRVQHVEKEKKGLEGKRDAALAFIKDENELAAKQSALYQIYVNECEDNIQVAGETVSQMQQKLEDEIARHRGNEAGIRALEKQYQGETKDFEGLEQHTKSILKQQEKLDKETVKFEEKKKHLNVKVKKLEKSISASQSSLSEANAYIDRLTEDMARNATSVAEIEESLQLEEKELGSIRDGLKGKTQGLSDEISAKQKSLEPWLQQINEKRSAISVAQSELAIFNERDNAGAQAIAAAEAKVAQIKGEFAQKTMELENLKGRKADSEARILQLEAEVGDISKREPSAKSQLFSARQKTDEARATLSHSQTQGNVLTGLNRLKDSGRIKGFHGRLGNLGTIDQTYDVAISTACPQLENLVVDSVEVGQQCIEYLRKNNLGRANFILLDKLSQRDVSEMETPEGVPRLIDLVRSKETRFRPAFYSVLQNTLVAADLDQANRIAYGAKRWRVVTLDGQLIDKSGTMSGGGTKVSKGLMSSKLHPETSKEQVTKLESDLATLEQQWQDLQSQHQATVDLLRKTKDEAPSLDTAIQKCTLEIDSMKRNIADAETRCSELSTSDKQSGKADKSKAKELEQAISQNNADISALQTESSGIETEIKDLQEKILEIGGIQLRSQKAKVDGLREQLATLAEEVSTAEVNKARTEKQQRKHEKTKNEATTELEGVASTLRKLDEEMQDQVRDTCSSRRAVEEAQERLESKREELAALRAEVDRQTAELNEIRGVELEMRNQLEEDQKVINENQKRLTYWQEKLGKLRIQSISEPGDAQGEQNLPTYTRDELQDLDKGLLKGEIAMLEEKIQNVNVDLVVLEEYRRRVEEHAARSSDLAEAVANRDAAKKRCEELRRLRLEGFMEGFSAISLRLKEMYQMITMGGNAELELVDSLDPFSEGILFSVMPPKKSWKNISNLSGGEKTLSSLALVFALHHYKPTPLYVMDEIDAALDFRNVSIVASYIKERTKNAQFIVISLRNNMFELASRLVGVYKVNHMTKSVTVENRDYIVRAP